MNAMVLCAGLGERMRPLTATIPKPVLPVLGRPIALLILDRLRRYGVERAAVNLHHLPDVVEETLGAGGDDALPEIAYYREDPILGTGGGILGAAPDLLGAGPFLVHNGDFLSDIDVEAVVRTHVRSGNAATLCVAPARPGYSGVEIDAGGTILSIAGRPEANPDRVAGRYLFTGMQVLDEEVVGRIPSEGESDIVRDVLWGLVGEGRVGAHVHEGFWWELGTPRHFLEGCLALIDLPRDTRLDVGVTDPLRTVGKARVAVGAAVDFHTGVQIIGRAGLGFAARVGEGTTIEDSVLMAETWVGPGAYLRRALVGPGTELPAGFEAEDALVCGAPDGPQVVPFRS